MTSTPAEKVTAIWSIDQTLMPVQLSGEPHWVQWDLGLDPNRDRGTLKRPPPTPPDMRVRIRRFGQVERKDW
jgi:hypothetical protein